MPEQTRSILCKPYPKRGSPQLTRFADLLADGLTPREAAERMGKDARYGNTMLQKLRIDLGWQAR